MPEEKSTENISDAFETVAAEVTAAPAPEPMAEVAGPETPAAPETSALAADRLMVKREWARGCVALCFYPLYARDPRWQLTAEEADGAAGEMQVFLQAVLDKYLPELMAKYAAGNPELARLVLAMGIVAWTKGRKVAAAPKPGAPAPSMPSALPVDAA